jgi:endogenous inhibitor of DNA gyrase (YacG/DUF329 family)
MRMGWVASFISTPVMRGFINASPIIARGMMATIIAHPPSVVARPNCPTCGTRMSLVRIFPDKPGYDQRTYECPRCQHDVTEIVQFQK